MKLPSEGYIREELYDRYAVPATIVKHCEKVRDVGMVLALGVRATGTEVNIELVDRLCLVHDSMKAVTLPPLKANSDFGYVPTVREIEAQAELKKRFPDTMHETLVAASLLKPEFPEFSGYVARIGSTGNPTYFEEGVELKVAHYADWRVQQDTVVPFAERLQYLKDTYLIKYSEKGDEWWQDAVRKEKELESELFAGLSFEPDELSSMVA